jgi:hypothetical protein
MYRGRLRQRLRDPGDHHRAKIYRQFQRRPAPGRKIVGVWQENEIVEGTYTMPDGTKYVGQWKFRERNGRGELTFPDGRHYIGDFKSDRRHGKGTLFFPDGRKYVGEFKFGERTGQGTMTYPDGKKVSGEFKNGEFVGEN